MNKLAKISNKKGGIVTGTIWGIGGLILAVILILVVTSTIKNANVIGNDQVNTFTIINESKTFSGAGIMTLANTPATQSFYTSFNATRLMNGTVGLTLDNKTLVEGVDYQIFASNGTIGNKTTQRDGARVTYIWVKTETQSQNVVNNFSSNFTTGIDNVSSKIPTILLIVAVVFLFGALILLFKYAQGMGIGGGNSAGSL